MTSASQTTSPEIDQAANEVVAFLTRYAGLDVSTDAALARYREQGHPDLEGALGTFEAATVGVAAPEEVAELRQVVDHAAWELSGAWLGMWSSFQTAQTEGLSKIQGPLDACCTQWTGLDELTRLKTEISALPAEQAERQAAIDDAIEALDVETATALRVDRDLMPERLRHAELRRSQLDTVFSRVFTELAKAAASGAPELAQLAQTAGLTADEFTRLFKQDPARAFAAFATGLDRVNKSGGDVFTLLDDLGISDVRVSRAMLSMAVSRSYSAPSLYSSSGPSPCKGVLVDLRYRFRY
ncbi:hypothetical protein QBC39DRAFT_376270 [Podospora conica]|nr:hypothetical protein QBC39DRAFT_376270 [Schizothecium conicum]